MYKQKGKNLILNQIELEIVSKLKVFKMNNQPPLRKNNVHRLEE
jgi:hypothetical protein